VQLALCEAVSDLGVTAFATAREIHFVQHHRDPGEQKGDWFGSIQAYLLMLSCTIHPVDTSIEED
jgi:hypothetical protein